MELSKRITIFTPTFNRAYVLCQLYESLKKQTNKSFIWLIVDDGSSDNTEELIDMWLIENVIEIRYYKQSNGGKQRAHNKGVELCDTELFFCVDSDDYITKDAVGLLIDTWDYIPNKERISGIVGLAGKDKRTPVGTSMPTGIRTSTLDDLYNKHRFRGDTALMYKTDILKKTPFYVEEGEKFIGEGYVYLQIDQHYSLYILDRIIYICEYLEDGYSTNVRKLIKDNPKGYMLLNKQSTLLSKTIKNRFKNSIKYMIGCILCKEKNPIRKAPNKGLALLAYPAAFLYCLKYYR